MNANAPHAIFCRAVFAPGDARLPHKPHTVAAAVTADYERNIYYIPPAIASARAVGSDGEMLILWRFLPGR